MESKCVQQFVLTPQKLEQRNDRYYETYETRSGCKASGGYYKQTGWPDTQGIYVYVPFFYETTRHKRKLVFFQFSFSALYLF